VLLNPSWALQQGKKLVFVTNNSTKSRKGYLGKFTGLGLKVNAEEIYSSSYAAAAYLESIHFPKDKKVLCRGAVVVQSQEPRLRLGHAGMCHACYHACWHVSCTPLYLPVPLSIFH
jgi:ribonucleotide monophosphatase NagD (HAD superfamily)